MNSILQKYKPLIDERIQKLCALNQRSTTPWADDVARRLVSFTVRGKTVRGSIFLYSCEIFKLPMENVHVDIAATLELLHAALLIHDDIIDHDRLRRGQQSIHVQYESIGEREKIPQPKEFGEGMAMCVGDIAIFGAFSHLASLSLPSEIHVRVMKCIAQEFLTVGFGEMHDIALGYLPRIPSTEEVLSMYLRKTARYTFSLPLTLGCIMTMQISEVQKTMETLGEYLGYVFQLRDDQLSVSGNVEKVGKTIGNDITENKKTYAAVLLWNSVDASERKSLETIYGNPALTPDHIQFVQTLLNKYTIVGRISNVINAYEAKAREMIMTLPVDNGNKQELLHLLTFLKTREK